MKQNTKSLIVGLWGLSNTGKSTLLNALVGLSVSVASRKRQTTVHAVRGIVEEGNTQLVFVDTPGVPKQQDPSSTGYLKRIINEQLYGVDLMLLVLDATKGTHFPKYMDTITSPAWVVLNKIDKVTKTELLPLVHCLSSEYNFQSIYMVSALKGTEISILKQALLNKAYPSPWPFEPNTETDLSFENQILDCVRKQLLLNLHQEIPYNIESRIEELIQQDGHTYHLRLLLVVPNQRIKTIIQGKQMNRQIHLIKALAYELKKRFHQSFIIDLHITSK